LEARRRATTDGDSRFPVVLDPDPGELGVEEGGVGDLFEVGPLGLDVPEEALDPGLVGRGVGPAEALHDGHEGHEVPGVVGGHRRAVVGHRQEHRPFRVVLVEVEAGTRRASRHSTMRACSKTTCTWVDVSSLESRYSIHLRDTRSTMANTARRARVKWVAS
jgi:hypothetical protein